MNHLTDNPEIVSLNDEKAMNLSFSPPFTCTYPILAYFINFGLSPLIFTKFNCIAHSIYDPFNEMQFEEFYFVQTTLI